MSTTAPLHGGPVNRALGLARTAALSRAGIVALTVCCIIAAGLRRRAGMEPLYGFLFMNLVLAWIPLVLSDALAWASRRDSTLWAVPMLAGAWIIFLPNAPYLLTDLVHLGEGVSFPNVLTLSLLALTGLVIGVKSVQVVQHVVEANFGVEAGWNAVRVIVVLEAVGVYVGRVLRWNSWNVISHPSELADTVLRSPSEPGRVALALVATVAFSMFFYISYRVLTGSSERPRLPTEHPMSATQP